MSNSWRTVDGDVSDQFVTFDFGAATAVTCVVISGHNLTSGATIRFEMHTADAWGAPDVSEVITWRSTHAIKFFTSASKRYCRLYIDDDSNPDGYIEIGRIFVGTYLDVLPSSNLPFKIANVRNDVLQITDQGNAYGTPGISRRVYQYDFTGSDTMVESIRAVYTECGLYKPIWITNFNTVYTHHDVLYGRLSQPLEESVLGEKRNNYSLVIEETF